MSISQFYFDFITAKLSGSAKWRLGLAAKFPEDEYILTKAAERLKQLAETKISDVSPGAWAEIEPHLGKPYLSEAINRAGRTIAFKNHPQDFSEFLEIAADIASEFALPVLAGGQ